jgi:hypothetical protein
MKQMKMDYIIPFVLSTKGIHPPPPPKLQRSLKLLDLRPALHSRMQKAAVFNTCFVVIKFSAEQ